MKFIDGKRHIERVKSKNMPPWDECWCGKTDACGGCRNCQTYQLFAGLGPTCGDKGVPETYYWSMGRQHKRTDEELQKLIDLQKLLREKYRT
jgi:hypothetical protein